MSTNNAKITQSIKQSEEAKDDRPAADSTAPSKEDAPPPVASDNITADPPARAKPDEAPEQKGQMLTKKVNENPSMKEFLANLRYNYYYLTIAAHPDEDIVPVPVNLDGFRTCLLALFTDAYRNWDKLAEIIPFTVLIRNEHYVRDMCRLLATATTFLLYSLLRSKTNKFYSAKYNRFSKRCTFDYNTEMPSGICYLVEQFGISLSVEEHRNNRYFHLWDSENNDTFGVPANIYTEFDSSRLSGFLQLLQKAGVHMTRLDIHGPARTLWDSTAVLDEGATGTSRSVFTTFDQKYYTLLRDVFLGIPFCHGFKGADPCIGRYYPIASAISDRKVLLALNAVPASDEEVADPSTPRVSRKRRKVASAKKSESSLPASLPTDIATSGFLQNVSSTGITYRVKSTSTSVISGRTVSTHTYDHEAVILGRGDADDALIRMRVGQGVTNNHVTAFFNNLFRGGP